MGLYNQLYKIPPKSILKSHNNMEPKNVPWQNEYFLHKASITILYTPRKKHGHGSGGASGAVQCCLKRAKAKGGF